ncbi:MULTISPECIES: helix-turn-helix transcriptional regulator [Morganellaceae]|uniref:helix-turn-helix transcriptional regulator n=1 Tax=Morganellaceae TaxID=1903414 RepID=UPI00224079E4|nr:DeoR family transcriptional regulator [Providencia rustigianii]
MKEKNSRHDRLALRLSIIISRLLSGEILSLRTLAEEFGVSERTIQRDFYQRLSHLDLVSEHDGYRLSGRLNASRPPDIFTFLQKVGLSGYFPGLTRKTVNNLIRSDLHYPCLACHNTIEAHPTSAECFYRIIQSITTMVGIQIHKIDGTSLFIEPYRLVLNQEKWYLIGCHLSQLNVIPLNHIFSVTITDVSFSRQKDICHLSSKAEFIQGLPYFDYFQHIMVEMSTAL